MSRTAPEIKDKGGHKGPLVNTSIIFPTKYPEWPSIISINLVGEKHTQMIYHMPWFHQ